MAIIEGQRPTWDLRLKWSGHVGNTKDAPTPYQIIAGSIFHDISISSSPSDAVAVKPDIHLRFELKPFGRRGPITSADIETHKNAEGLSLWVRVLNSMDFERLILSFEILASANQVNRTPNYEKMPFRTLIFNSGQDGNRRQCVLEELAVLSHWNGQKYPEIIDFTGYRKRNSNYSFYFMTEFANSTYIGMFLNTTIVNLERSQKLQSASSLAINDFKRMYITENNYPDIKLKSKDNMILSSHKFVLAARSPYFRRLLQGVSSEGILISVNKVNAKPLLAILHWMYTDEFSETVERFFEEILEGAKLFELEHLPEALDKQMITLCNADNMFQLITIAKKHSMQDACKDIKEFIKKNIDAVDQEEIKGHKGQFGARKNDNAQRIMFWGIMLILMLFFYTLLNIMGFDC